MNNEIRMWDNWYCPISENNREALLASLPKCPDRSNLLSKNEPCFVVGYLNSERTYYDGELGPNQHHLNSRVGTALTSDFNSLIVLSHEAFTAQVRECSIWSGSFVQGGLNSQGVQEYLFFYTFRDPDSPCSLSQRIGVAYTTDFVHFSRLPGIIAPDSRWYLNDSVPGDTAIHAFRDPFPFQVDGQNYLLISAKSNSPTLQSGKIGKRPGNNGVIAVYKISLIDGALTTEPTSLCFASTKPELEVASLYFDQSNNQYVLFFSAHSEEDYLSRTADKNGNPVGSIAETGLFYQAPLHNFQELLVSPPQDPVIIEPTIVSGIAPNSYANRLIPEHGGISLGFDCDSGLPALGKQRRENMQPCQHMSLLS